MYKLLFLGFTLAALQSASAGEPAADEKALQGTWTPVQLELAGQPLPDAVVKAITLKLEQKNYEVSVTGAPESDFGTWTLDATSGAKGMSITGVKGPNAGKTFLAIYELSGDTLRICYDLSGAGRPEGFKTSAGTKLFLARYTRKKQP